MKTLSRFVLSGIIPLLIFLFQCNGDNGITDDDSETLSNQLIGGWMSTEQISEMLIEFSESLPIDVSAPVSSCSPLVSPSSMISLAMRYAPAMPLPFKGDHCTYIKYFVDNQEKNASLTNGSSRE